MASPVVETTAESNTTSAGANHTVTMPSGIVAGDLVVVCMNIGSTSATINALAGWTELLDEGVSNGLFIAYQFATGSISNPTFVSSANTRDATISYRISGAIDPALRAPEIGTTATGTSVNPNPPSVTPTGGSKDYLAIALAGMAGEFADDDTWHTGTPANYTNRLGKSCGTVGTNLGGIIVTAQRQFTGTSEDPGTFTITSAAWRAQTVIVHPALTSDGITMASIGTVR